MMLNSSERMQFIADYLTAYEQKISMLNHVGLLDAAVLFELLAVKICELWFGQSFSNLNVRKANTPYVDLLSDDGKIYVQVSTVQNIPAKIRSTLKKIADSKDDSAAKIGRLYFLVLDNGSLKNVKDYSGAERIGNIDFIADRDLITVGMVLEKAKRDEQFQQELYQFLLDEDAAFHKISEKLIEKVETSRLLLSQNIDDLIHGEYEIDCSALLNTIQSENMKFVSVQGEAGSGKSALCKKLLMQEETVLFARAEKIAEVVRLEDIWDIDLRKCLHYLKGSRIVFFIDALEFIADCGRTKQDLLHELYAVVKEYPNAYIITSCRTSDRQAFIQLESLYHIRTYQLSELSDEQIVPVAEKYPVIKRLWLKREYLPLLRSPFYLDMIVSHISDEESLRDLNVLRIAIWEEVICLRKKAKEYRFFPGQISSEVERIVITRAKNFTVGVDPEIVDAGILEALKREGIIIEGYSGVRLKHDIFEDICFERWIDKRFDECRGDYDVFFESLLTLGKCVYRRFQIWIENKLFEKQNREKFLYRIVFSTNNSSWKEQALIGILKSDKCDGFIEEYKTEILDRQLEDFLGIINRHAFELFIINLKNDNMYTKPKPVGEGRQSILRLLYASGCFRRPELRKQISKTCCDYAKYYAGNNAEPSVCRKENGEAACRILEFYLEEFILSVKGSRPYELSDEDYASFSALYTLAEYSGRWIEALWVLLQEKRTSRRDCHISEEIVEYTIKHPTRWLVKYLPEKLCELADSYWLSASEKLVEGGHGYYRAQRYGLSRCAENYPYDVKKPDDNIFFILLSKYQFWVALKWALHVTNHAASNLKKNQPDQLYEVVLPDNNGELHHYYANTNFWLAGLDNINNNIPELIGDIIFILRKQIFEWVSGSVLDEKSANRFLSNIRDTILKKSNNIIMISLIAQIGAACFKRFPGYALCLAQSLDLLRTDISAHAAVKSNPTKELLERQIMRTMSISELPKRYNWEGNEWETLQSYILRCQAAGDEAVRKQAEKVIDELYRQITDEKNQALDLLMVQRMDFRRAHPVSLDKHTVAFIPEVSGEAKKLLAQTKQKETIDGLDEINRIASRINQKIDAKSLSESEYEEAIQELIALSRKVHVPQQVQYALILLIAQALSSGVLSEALRSKYCLIWIDGIQSIFADGSFCFEASLSLVLFRQVEHKLLPDAKDALEKLMEACLLYDGQNGILIEISGQLKDYLIGNQTAAKLLFQKLNSEKEKDLYRSCHLSGCGLRLSDPVFFAFMQGLLKNLFVEISADHWDDPVDVYSVLEVRASLRRYLNIQEMDEVCLALDLLFRRVDFALFNREIYEFYEDCFSDLLPMYFDAYEKPEERRRIESIVNSMEERILAIPNEKERNRLTKLLLLTPPRYQSKDWNELKTSFSYRDKSFLQEIWSKYGKYHPSELIRIIHQMHICALLPEALLPLYYCLAYYTKDRILLPVIAKLNESDRFMLNVIMTKASLDFRDKIKSDAELLDAYEGIMTIMIDAGDESAGILLDEFWIH